MKLAAVLLFCGVLAAGDFVLVHGGAFKMGSATVRVDDFEMLDHTVTNSEYGQFVRSTRHRSPLYWTEGKIPAGLYESEVPEFQERQAASWERRLLHSRAAESAIHCRGCAREAMFGFSGRKNSLMRRSFGRGHVIFCPDEQARFLAALNIALEPDIRFEEPSRYVGFQHRRLSDRDVYFVVNTSETRLDLTARFRIGKKHPEV